MAFLEDNLFKELNKMQKYASEARISYITAIRFAKKNRIEESLNKFLEGDELFQKVHDLHYQLLIQDSHNSYKGIPFSTLLLHVEDQFMAAESFRIAATEFIDLYKLLNKRK